MSLDPDQAPRQRGLKVVSKAERLIVDLSPVLDRVPRQQRYRYAKRLEDALWEQVRWIWIGPLRSVHKPTAVEPRSMDSLAQIIHDKTAVLAYGTSLLVGSVSALSAEWIGMIIGAIGVVITVSVNWYYKRRDDERKAKEAKASREADKAKADYYRGRQDD